MFNYLYKKDALDLYSFLFYNKPTGDLNKNKIKNILYVSYAYIYLNFNDVSIDKVIDYFSHLEDINYLDNLMINNDKIKKYYNFFSIHNDIIDEDIKNKYDDGLKLIKEEISRLNLSEYGIYLKAKKDIYSLLEQSLNKEISLEQIQIYENVFNNNIEILSKYMDKNDIEGYQKYFNIKVKKDKSLLLNGAMKLFENKVDSFSELELLKDLKYKTNYSDKFNNNNLDIIELNNMEIGRLRQIILKKIISNILLLVMFLLVGGKFYLGLFDKTNDIEQTSRILVILFLSMFVLFPILSLIVNLIKLIFVKKKVKGQFGFINKKDYNYRGDSRNNSNYYYSVFLPKFNEFDIINSKYCTKNLKEKDLVILLKVLNSYYLIKCEESRFL